MALLSDDRPRAVRRGDGLQRVRGDRAAGESQPVSLHDQADAVDFDRLSGDVHRDALRLSKSESTLDCLRIADTHDPFARRGVWFLACQRRASLDQAEGLFNSTIRDREARARAVSGAIPG